MDSESYGLFIEVKCVHEGKSIFKGKKITDFMQIRSLLHDYLATDGDDSYRTAPRQARPQRNIPLNQRDRNKVNIKIPSQLRVLRTQKLTRIENVSNVGHRSEIK